MIRRLAAEIRQDADFLKVLRGTHTAAWLLTAAAALGFFSNVILGRLLGPAGVGVYYLALTVLGVAGLLSRLGLDNALLRFTAAAADSGDWATVRGVHRRGIMLGAGAGGIVALLVFVLAPVIAVGVFGEERLTAPVRLMAGAVVPWTLTFLYSELLKGLERIRDALVLKVVMPMLHVGLLLVLATRYGVDGAAMSLTASAWLTLGVAALLWRRAVPADTGGRSAIGTRLLLATGLPLFFVASTHFVMAWADITMLGIWRSAAEVGTYGAAVRVALLASYALGALNQAIAPRFSALHARGDTEALQRLARRGTRLVLLFAAPLTLVLLLFPELVLALFGPEFRTGGMALRTLAVGQFVSAAAGSVGYLLMMSGNEKTYRNLVVLSALLNVALNAILIPRFGIEGAAVATASSVVLLNALSTVMVRQRLGIRIW